MSREFGSLTERLTSSSSARMKMKAFPLTLTARSPHGKSSWVSGYSSAKARRSDSIFEVAFITNAECRMQDTECCASQFCILRSSFCIPLAAPTPRYVLMVRPSIRRLERDSLSSHRPNPRPRALEQNDQNARHQNHRQRRVEITGERLLRILPRQRQEVVEDRAPAGIQRRRGHEAE